MVNLWVLAMACFLISQRLLELYIAENNYKWSIKAGAQEFGKEHYSLFFVLHGCWFIGWIVESSIGKTVAVSELWYVWLSLFVIAQVVRYWCIASLGKAWNTRILVIPDRKLISRGPYQYIKHPNYVAVAIELLVVPLLFGAVITATLATLCNTWLILGIRIPEEEKALSGGNIEKSSH
ncbi:isoprenylcysteine carboxyl methyltransferase family protein [Pelosinus propionicus]|uniref:Methyltransferase n=1 Tax=Pelosinus propionicus DSM 13327 TaxID=1123291 RepID=A0A1I4MVK1_9FIRM|nr:isoprenylcysteine carboxylmethyltransferase family protein [Pelosinus propionicus]SFM07096.1 methyltransferase [Pelosinus propionicus DSM 13327]